MFIHLLYAIRFIYSYFKWLFKKIFFPQYIWRVVCGAPHAIMPKTELAKILAYNNF